VPDVFGANRRQVESLAAQRTRSASLEATYITLASNVVAAAIPGGVAARPDRGHPADIAAEEKSLQILRDQFRLGFAMRIDRRGTGGGAGTGKMLLPPLQRQLEQTRDLIRALAGNLPNQDVAETFELDALQLPPELPLSLPPSSSSSVPMCGPPGQCMRQRAGRRRGGRHAAAISISGNAGATPTIRLDVPLRRPFWTLVGGLTQPSSKAAHCCTKSAQRKPRCDRPRLNIRPRACGLPERRDTLHASISDADALAADVDAENSSK